MTSYVLPRLPVDDARDGVPANAELRGDDVMRKPTLRQGANRQHLSGRQLLLTEGVATALRNRIVDVLVLRAQKQMLRVDAARVVALVQDAQVVGNRAVRQLPRQPVREDAREALTLPANVNVTCCVRNVPL